MKAYRWTTNLKAGLVAFAALIAVASVLYTSRLVEQLKQREQVLIQLIAEARQQLIDAQNVGQNPHIRTLNDMEVWLRSGAAAGLSGEDVRQYLQAVDFAQAMPPTIEVDFIGTVNTELSGTVPSLIVSADTSNAFPYLSWVNVDLPGDSLVIQGDVLRLEAPDQDRVRRALDDLRDEMAATYEPIPIDLTFADTSLQQLLYYGESDLIKELRLFPYVQLLFVGLFVLVGYVGFSYVRRNEQGSLWVGMAKEAAHQLGTPISSLMGWTQLLRAGELPAETVDTAFDEIDNDIQRLQRVASRFSDIGSVPKLEAQSLAACADRTIAYIRRRIPQQGKTVSLTAELDPRITVPLNAELFEWVVENLLKNALDAIETDTGSIHVEAVREGTKAVLRVRDTGKGIDRSQWKNIFRPGYSTKKRGWGLGLSLAKRIVEDYHGGSLAVEQSQPGQGATFRIELPND
ncbi:MAG: HAMP domain-containing sensor histidine kinase [Bacteroidota bacterium]